MRAMHHFEKLGAGGSGVINGYQKANNTISEAGLEGELKEGD